MNTRTPISATITGLAALALPVLLVGAPMAWWLADAIAHEITPLGALGEQLSTPALQAAFLRTTAVALLACGLASLLAVPIGCVLGRCLVRGTRLGLLFGLLPLLVPPMLTAAALRAHGIMLPVDVNSGPLAASGLRTNDIQLILVYALHYFPLLVLTVAAALRRLAPDADEAAQTLGAGRWIIWHRILLPLAMPGFAVGACLILLRIIDDPTTPLVLGIDGMLAPQLYINATSAGPDTSAIPPAALLMLTISSLLVVFGWRALSPPVRSFGAPHPSRPRPHCGIGSATATALLLLVAVVLTLMPYVAVLLAAIGEGTAGMATPAWPALPAVYLPTIAKSVLFAIFAGLLALLAATLTGVAAAELSPVSRVARGATSAVLAAPAMVLALAMLLSTQQLLRGGGASNLTWVLLALVVTLKLLPFAQYLIAARVLETRTARADAAATGRRRRGGTLGSLAGRQLLVFGLAFVTLLTDLPAAMLLLDAADASFAMLWFDDVLADRAWQQPALLLLLLLGGMLGTAVYLSQPASRKRGSHRARDEVLLETP